MSRPNQRRASDHRLGERVEFRFSNLRAVQVTWRFCVFASSRNGLQPFVRGRAIGGSRRESGSIEDFERF
jgi:hypothetical protein